MKIEVRKPADSERKEASSWPVWEKEVSSFPWHYDEKETCLILDGEVTIEAGNEKVHFKSPLRKPFDGTKIVRREAAHA